MEKGWRLYLNPSHLSSFQSRNEEYQKWGGAIVAGGFILSFSGLPELGDEAIMLVLASKLGWIDKETVREIVQISSNPFFCPDNSNVIFS